MPTPPPRSPATTRSAPDAMCWQTGRQHWSANFAVVVVLLLVQIFFGGNAVVSKAAVHSEHIDPVVFSFGRDAGAAVLLHILVGLSEPQNWRLPKREETLPLVAIGLTGVALSMVVMVVALKFITPVNAMIYQPLQPVLALCLSVWPFQTTSGLGLKWPPTSKCLLRIAGILCSVGGAIYVPVMQSHNEGQQVMVGNALMLLSVTSGSMYQVLNKRFLSQSGWSALMTAAWTYAFGAIFVALILPFQEGAWPRTWTLGMVASLSYAIFLTSGFNYVAMSWANQRTGPVLVTAFMPFQVVATAVLEWLFQGRPPTSVDVIGGTLVICGLSAVVLMPENKDFDRMPARVAIQAPDAGQCLTRSSSTGPVPSPNMAEPP